MLRGEAHATLDSKRGGAAGSCLATDITSAPSHPARADHAWIMQKLTPRRHRRFLDSVFGHHHAMDNALLATLQVLPTITLHQAKGTYLGSRLRCDHGSQPRPLERAGVHPAAYVAVHATAPSNTRHPRTSLGYCPHKAAQSKCYLLWSGCLASHSTICFAVGSRPIRSSRWREDSRAWRGLFHCRSLEGASPGRSVDGLVPINGELVLRLGGWKLT